MMEDERRRTGNACFYRTSMTGDRCSTPRRICKVSRSCPLSEGVEVVDCALDEGTGAPLCSI